MTDLRGWRYETPPSGPTFTMPHAMSLYHPYWLLLLLSVATNKSRNYEVMAVALHPPLAAV